MMYSKDNSYLQQDFKAPSPPFHLGGGGGEGVATRRFL